MREFGLTKTGYRLEGKFSPTTNLNSTMNLRNVFDLVTYDVNEILHNVVIFTLNSKESEFRIS